MVYSSIRNEDLITLVYDKIVLHDRIIVSRFGKKTNYYLLQ